MSEQFSVQVPMDSDRPLAEQIRRVLSDEILSGTLPPGTRLASRHRMLWPHVALSFSCAASLLGVARE